MEPVTFINEEWALDFVSGAIASGRHIRFLNIADACTRVCLALEVDTSFASRRVTRVLDQVIAGRGTGPRRIRCDNGPELTSRHFMAWCAERRIELIYIQPGKPQQNARLESMNGKLRDEFLNVSWFAKSVRCAARRRHGVRTTTRSGRIPVWDIGHRQHSSATGTASLRPPVLP